MRVPGMPALSRSPVTGRHDRPGRRVRPEPVGSAGCGDVFRSPGWRELARRVAEAADQLTCPVTPALAPAAAGAFMMRSESTGPTLKSQLSPPRADRVEVSDVERSNDDGPPAIPTDSGVEADHAEAWRLVRAAQEGDGEAFGALYDRYVQQVFRFIYYRVNDRGLAEDFTSETFLRALRRISTINYQGRDIGAWFMTIARNIVFDHTKSARYRLELTTGDPLEPQHSEPSPETAVLARLTNARLMSAVMDLSDEQQECIVLRFLQGLSVAETAAAMGKNDGAIKALQHRAVKRLAGMLADELA